MFIPLKTGIRMIPLVLVVICAASCSAIPSWMGVPRQIPLSEQGLLPPITRLNDTSSVMLLTDKGLEPYQASSQAIITNDLVLTVAHALPEYRGLRQTSHLSLPDGEVLRYVTLASGVLEGESIVPDINPVSPETDHDFLRQVQVVNEQMVDQMKNIRSSEAIDNDWVLLRLSDAPRIISSPLEVELEPVLPGTRVSVFHVSQDGKTVSRLDTVVVEVISENPNFTLPSSGYIALWNPRRVETDGWSGGFVGRQDESGQWRLIGVLSASSIENRLIFVTRPPVEILEWFAGGGIGELPISASESPPAHAGGS